MKRLFRFFLVSGMFACFIVSYSYSTELWGDGECHSFGEQSEKLDKTDITVGNKKGPQCVVPEEGDCSCGIGPQEPER